MLQRPVDIGQASSPFQTPSRVVVQTAPPPPPSLSLSLKEGESEQRARRHAPPPAPQRALPESLEGR